MSKKPQKGKKTQRPAALVRATELILSCEPRLRSVALLCQEYGLSFEESSAVYGQASAQWGSGDQASAARELVSDQMYALLREALADRDHASTARFMRMIADARDIFPKQTQTEPNIAGGPESEERLQQLLEKHGLKTS